MLRCRTTKVVHGKGSLLRPRCRATTNASRTCLPARLDVRTSRANTATVHGRRSSRRGTKWYHHGVGRTGTCLDRPARRRRVWLADLAALYARARLLSTTAIPPASPGSTAATAGAARFYHVRRGRDADDVLLFACNFTPIPCQIVPHRRTARGLLGRGAELDAADATAARRRQSRRRAQRGRRVSGHPQSIVVELPPLGWWCSGSRRLRSRNLLRRRSRRGRCAECRSRG